MIKIPRVIADIPSVSMVIAINKAVWGSNLPFPKQIEKTRKKVEILLRILVEDFSRFLGVANLPFPQQNLPLNPNPPHTK